MKDPERKYAYHAANFVEKAKWHGMNSHLEVLWMGGNQKKWEKFSLLCKPLFITAKRKRQKRSNSNYKASQLFVISMWSM